jgi:hypothetical protein
VVSGSGKLKEWKWRRDEKARQNESFEGRSEKERCQKVPKEVQRRKKVSYVRKDADLFTCLAW